jgi:hypothetical protein
MSTEEQITQKLHVLDREFKRPGVLRRPPTALHDIIRYASMCLILLCLLFALGIATFFNPDYHFSIKGIIDPLDSALHNRRFFLAGVWSLDFAEERGQSMKISTDRINVTAVVLTIAFGVFILLVVRHQEATMKSGGCTTCGGATASESPEEKLVLGLLNASAHADDIPRAATLGSVSGLSVAQIRGNGTL